MTGKKFGILLALVMIVVLSTSVLFAACDKDAKRADGYFTVTFVNGDEETTKTVAQDSVVEKPTDPSKSGYIFDGWYNGSEKYDFETPVTADIELTAKFVAKQYNALVSAGGGKLASGHDTDQITLTYGQTFAIETASKDGMLFEGYKYKDNLVTDSQGYSLAAWTVDDDANIVFTASYRINQDNTADLAEAIATMSENYNFTAQYIEDGATVRIAKITERKYESNLFGENPNIGFLVAGPSTDLKVYKVDYKSDTPITDIPYSEEEGVDFTVDQLRRRYYILPSLDVLKFYRESETVFCAKNDYVASLAGALFGDAYAATAVSLRVEITGGYTKRLVSITYNDGVAKISFTNINETTVDFTKYNPPHISQLPESTNPNLPKAPETYGNADVMGVDAFKANAYPNYEGTSALQQAINKAREQVHINLADIFTCDWCASSERTRDNSVFDKYYVIDYKGYEQRILGSNSDFDDERDRGLFTFLAGGELYKAEISDGALRYSKIADEKYKYTKENMAIAGNLFYKLTDDMFEPTNEEDGVYAVKPSKLDEVGAIVFANLQDVYNDDEVRSHFTRAQQIGGCMESSRENLRTAPFDVEYIKLTVKNGSVTKIEARRSFTLTSSEGNKYDDNHQIVTYNCSDTITGEWPYDSLDIVPEYTEDQLKLKAAIENTGYNYSLEFHTVNDTLKSVAYFGDNLLMFAYYYCDQAGEIEELDWWRSSAFVYINDYAYLVTFKSDGTAEIGEEPYKPYVNRDTVYYRAYMEKQYLTLSLVNANDFSYNSSLSYNGNQGVYTLSNNSRYNYYMHDLFQWYYDAEEVEDMQVFITTKIFQGKEVIDSVIIGKVSSGAVEPYTIIRCFDIGNTEFQL